MKNIYKISLAFISIIIFGNIYANGVNFNARISDGSSYLTGTSFMDGPFNVSPGTSLDFEAIVQTKAGSGVNTYSVNFPTGFQYQAPYILTECNLGGIQALDNIFRFTTPNLDCIYEFHFKYKALSSGNFSVNLLQSGSITTLMDSIAVNVSGNNTILSTSTLDQNNDGIIDGYLINTLQPTNIAGLSGLLIGGVSPTGYTQSGSNTSWIISFNSGILSTSSLPQITGSFGGITLDNADIIENDGVAPTFTNSNIGGGTYLAPQTINLYNLSENGTLYYSTGGTATTSSSVYSSGLIINSNTVLSVLAVDKFGNSKLYTYTYNFSCGNNPSNGSYGAYPTCNITCNSGYSLSGGSCNLVNNGGGGGGGGISTPPSTSSGTTSTGSTSSGTTLSGTIAGSLSGFGYETIDSVYFKNIDEARQYLRLNIRNEKTKGYIETYYSKLVFDNIDYFLKNDLTFSKQYNRIINAYALYLLYSDAYLSGNQSSAQKFLIASSFSVLATGFDIVSDESKKSIISFIDIDNSFAKDDIISLAMKGVVKGYMDSTFRPNNPVTRAEFLGMVMKSLNISLDEKIIKTDFSDIPEDGSWMAKYIVKAQEYGIKGQEINVSSFSGAHTIGDVYDFKMLDFMNSDPSVFKIQEILNSNGYDNLLNGIFDFSTVSNLNDFIFKKTGIKYSTNNLGPQKLNAFKSIVIEIKPDQTIKRIFRPNDSISRAEAMAMLLNIAKISVNEQDKSDFTDIPTGATWMDKYIAKAKSLGIISGQEIGGRLVFRPNDPISRAETTRIITRTLSLQK